MPTIAITKFQTCHGIINNAPVNLMIYASAPVLMTREFKGAGAPSSSTLGGGNGKYCGTNSGSVLAAMIAAGGAGFVPGDVLTGAESGGTVLNHIKINVDTVTSAGGIVDFHVTTVGTYSAYPSNPVTMTGGTGSGATITLALQPEDHYLDTTANALYACTSAGTNATSGWTQISGAGTSAPGESVFVITALSNADYLTCRTWDGTNVGGTDIQVAKINRFRTSLSGEIVDGVAIGFSSYAADNQRMASDGVNVEVQLVYPRYVTLSGEGFTTHPYSSAAAGRASGYRAVASAPPNRPAALASAA